MSFSFQSRHLFSTDAAPCYPSKPHHAMLLCSAPSACPICSALSQWSCLSVPHYQLHPFGDQWLRLRYTGIQYQCQCSVCLYPTNCPTTWAAVHGDSCQLIILFFFIQDMTHLSTRVLYHAGNWSFQQKYQKQGAIIYTELSLIYNHLWLISFCFDKTLLRHSFLANDHILRIII